MPPDSDRIKRAAQAPLFFDLRNIHVSAQLRAADFHCASIGRPQRVLSHHFEYCCTE